jgi:hypothetical protein
VWLIHKGEQESLTKVRPHLYGCDSLEKSPLANMLIFDQLEQMFANLNKLVQNLSKFVQICSNWSILQLLQSLHCMFSPQTGSANLHKFAQVCCSLLWFALLLVLYTFKKLPKLDGLAELV